MIYIVNILKLYVAHSREESQACYGMSLVRVHPSLVNVCSELIASVDLQDMGRKKTTAQDIP
jgi:hypothetical protein